jgi:hypothetical protein
MLSSILPSSLTSSTLSKPKSTLPSSLRRNTYTGTPHTHSHSHSHHLSLSTTPSAQTANMDSRHHRAHSPRRHVNPARSSTGTFGDAYYDSSYYGRPSSPRSSADRLSTHLQPYSSSSYLPTSSASSSASRNSGLKYDTYTTRPRRNTDDRMARPSSAIMTSMPLRTPYTPHADSYSSHSPARREHKKIYSVDDTHTAKLVAERETIESPRLRDSSDSRSYGVSSGGHNYHSSYSGHSGHSGHGSHGSHTIISPATTKPSARHADLGDGGYSYTDPASMYRDTEPAWRRPRAGSLERGARPTSMIIDRPPRSSTRDLGPPPSTRGFDKINGAAPPRHHARSSSIEHSRDLPKYDTYTDSTSHRPLSARHAPAIHQEPRRDVYHDDYDRERRGREVESKRHSTVDRFEDRDVATRGFGIAPGGVTPVANPGPDRHPPARNSNAQEPSRARLDEYASAAPATRVPESRPAERRDAPPTYDTYDDRSRKRDSSRQDTSRAIPIAAGAAAGAAATVGVAAYSAKAKERERETEQELIAERERRREWDERDRRDRHDDRRENRRPEERREPVPPVATSDTDRRPRDRQYPEEEKAPPMPPRKAPSPEGSDVDRPRHYVDRDADRRKELPPAEAVDPDEEYRRRVAQEAERSRRAAADRHDSDDSDRERDRRRHRDTRDRSRSRSRGRDDRSRVSPPRDAPSSRYDDRSSSIYDANVVQEPESVDKLNPDAPGKSVQIVVPRKESPPALKGILRKPTEKFPEDPEPIREGVAPHKDSLKGKDIPVGARWTRIDRKLVNPEALERAKERFEERMDCVIVLRVLTKEEIQKLADKTKEIRERRGAFVVPLLH